MPHKHTIKVFIEDGFYHVYNRGVDKRSIFEDDQDYRVFLHLLKYYLSPTEEKFKHPISEVANLNFVRPRPLANIGNEIQLLSYCLMPNHYHLLIKQSTKEGMTKLIRRLTTTYVMYFNKRQDRSGYLFQGRYKAVLVKNESYLLHLSRYIHINPKELNDLKGADLASYPYSSYPYYLGLKNAAWLKPEMILSYFDKKGKLPFLLKYPSYKDFVESNDTNPRDLIGPLSID